MLDEFISVGQKPTADPDAGGQDAKAKPGPINDGPGLGWKYLSSPRPLGVKRLVDERAL
jgi:hypothetical protein